MLKVGGIWCSPVEVESCLIGHPAVLEAAVVGQADADQLIKPKAYRGAEAGRLGGAALTDELTALVQEDARALQVSALGRVRGRAAQDGDRQDPALQAQDVTRIRPFEPADLEACYAISLATGFEGGDASHLYRDPNPRGTSTSRLTPC